MDIQSSTHPGSHGLRYPTLTRSRTTEVVVPAEAAKTTATLHTALDILRARLAESGIALPVAADPEAFSPQRVADRILDFVGLAVGRAEPDEQDQVLAEARKGVERGFREARDILESLNVLQGDIAANVDATYERVMQGLDELAAHSAISSGTVQQAVTASQSGTAQSGAVRIETREGDLITVNFSRISAEAELAAVSKSDAGTVAGAARATYESTQLSYSIEGELSEDEQAAIDHLLKRVDTIAERFFAGNVQAAFQQASHLNVSGEQIAAYAFTLEQRSVQTAVSQYQTTQADTVVSNGVPTGTQALADYANQLRDLLDKPGVDTVADPRATAGQLLEANAALRAMQEFGDSLHQGTLSLLRELLAYLVNGPQVSAAESMLPDDESVPETDTTVDAVSADVSTVEDSTSVPEIVLQVA